ncbi:MAG TPA: RNA-binding protein [Candidatus Binatia bacterium]|nr:RNA-binding protein [Candidatus Binatia bacterium]
MKNIYVGNLSFDATEDQLRSMFEAYGPVERVSIITDRDSGQPRGFAFVEMPDDDSAGKAMQALNGSSVGGRNITVNEARPKADRPRREGGGRGGYGSSGGRGRSGAGGWGRY